ncbi:hypothetical protein MKZ38_002876 [Zalerion maritima]|uniref:Nephrocystin 3-like N-terminal domain-containing protein n=1 Tax=Zalerion maritima TaxID=339359 RepID=A0AAD5WVB3_9PEZI|nr:hypothetical protein MKZ38_002876 [Zalerion maritima]
MPLHPQLPSEFVDPNPYQTLGLAEGRCMQLHTSTAMSVPGPLAWRTRNLPRDGIPSIGLTVVHEPDDPRTAVIDIVLVGGLGSHPVRTWLSSDQNQPTDEPHDLCGISDGQQGGNLRGVLRTASTRSTRSKRTLVKKSSHRIRGDIHPSEDPLSSDLLHSNPTPLSSGHMFASGALQPKTPKSDVYWPLDLLPKSCPTTRVLVWGCHSIVMNGKLLRSQNSIFVHSEGLLRELADFRDETGTTGRPVVFVAHSTGGIIVKEILRRAEAKPQQQIKDILYSTSACIFLASPHRVSSVWSLMDAVKNMAHLTLGVDPRDPNLPSLFGGADGEEVEAGRQVFLRLWMDHNFRVKTFQEKNATQQKYGEERTELKLRREASFLGRPRERPETMEGTHLDMCKFLSGDDPEWKQFAEVFQRLVYLELQRLRQLNTGERECLEALEQGSLDPKENHPTGSYLGTCLWLYDIPEFGFWHHRTNEGRGKVLWLKGPPGSGKSVLLKSLRHRIEKQWASCGAVFLEVAAEGRDLDAVYFLPTQKRRYTPNPSRVYRALLSRLFPHDPKLKKQVLSMYKRNKTFADARVVSYFVDDYIRHRVDVPNKRTFIFVDASDSCGADYLQGLLRHLATLARNSDLSIIVTSVEHSDVTLPKSKAIQLRMQNHNGNDVLRYVNLNLLAEWEERNKTVHRVAEKASGVFLWAEIVVNILNAAIEEGANPDLIDYTIEQIPATLEGLYHWLMATLSAEEKADALILFQWVLLASEPLRLNDLRFAVRVTKTWSTATFIPDMALSLESPTSIRDLRRPNEQEFDSPHQFHRWVRQRSLGLIELRASPGATADGSGAEPVGLRRVQVAHESVRSFFLEERGYAVLVGEEKAKSGSFNDVSHFALLNACLTYLNMSDFEPLGHASPHPTQAQTAVANPPTLQSPSSLTSSIPLSRFAVQPSPMPLEESKFWRRAATDQRHLVMSSYPFLRYAVANILYHLLSPRVWRYFPPQQKLLSILSRDRCKLWRRWTALLGTNDPSHVLSLSESALDLSGVTSGAGVRLERVFRRLNRLVAAERKILGSQSVEDSKEGTRNGSILGRARGELDPDIPVGSLPPSVVATGKSGRVSAIESLRQILVDSPTPGIAVTTSEPSPTIYAPTPEPLLRISLPSNEERHSRASVNPRVGVNRVMGMTALDSRESRNGEASLPDNAPAANKIQEARSEPNSALVKTQQEPPALSDPRPGPHYGDCPDAKGAPYAHTVVATGTREGVGIGAVSRKSSRETMLSRPCRSPHISPKGSRERLRPLAVPADPHPPPVVKVRPGELLCSPGTSQLSGKQGALQVTATGVVRPSARRAVSSPKNSPPPKSAPPPSHSSFGFGSSLPSPATAAINSTESLLSGPTVRKTHSDNTLRGRGFHTPTSDVSIPFTLESKTVHIQLSNPNAYTPVSSGSCASMPPLSALTAATLDSQKKSPRSKLPLPIPAHQKQKSISPILPRKQHPGFSFGDIEDSPTGWSPVLPRGRDTFGSRCHERKDSAVAVHRMETSMGSAAETRSRHGYGHAPQSSLGSTIGVRSPTSTTESDKAFWSPAFVEGSGYGQYGQYGGGGITGSGGHDETPLVSPLTSGSEPDTSTHVRFDGLPERK